MSNFLNKLTAKTKIKRPTTPSSRPAFLAEPHINASIVKGNFKTVVALPRGVDENEWLAANTCDFFDHLNLFYGAVADYCTTRDCPSMTAGPATDFTWTDASRKTLKLAAPTYVDYVMSWVQNLLDAEDVFPTKTAHPFPADFATTVRAVWKQLHRIFAHLYYSHYEQLLALHCEGHVNSLYAHFIVYAREFDLLEKKELAVMADLIGELEAAGRLR